MELIANKEPRAERRIIVETPQLVFLFDMFHSLLTLERDATDRDIPFPIDFEEVVPEVEEIINGIIEAVVERVEADKLITLLQNAKTGQTSVDNMAVLEIINKMIESNKDALAGILAESLRMLLSDACKAIVDEVVEAGEFLNFKRINIKTRRHVVVLC